MNLPDCMYDYRHSFEKEVVPSNIIYCSKCGDEISEHEFIIYDGICKYCLMEQEEDK